MIGMINTIVYLRICSFRVKIPSLTLNKKRNSAKLFNKGLKCCFVLCNEYAYII